MAKIWLPGQLGSGENSHLGLWQVSFLCVLTCKREGAGSGTKLGGGFFFGVFSYKLTNFIVKAPPSGPHLNPITSQRPDV